MNAQNGPKLAPGLAYERFMGRWSRPIGRQFIDWLGLPPHQRWLEAGCGTGAFTQVILSAAQPSSILALDPSEQQIAYARACIRDDRVAIRIGNAMSIDASDGAFDVAVAGLVLNFIPEQRKAVTEMTRVVRPGGTVAAYVWDFAGRRNVTQHLSDAIAAISPDAERGARAAQQADTTRPEALATLFQSTGLTAVKTKDLDITAQFDDFDDYWTSNTALMSSISVIGMAGGSLAARQVDELRAQLMQRLPTTADGKIAFQARAWAVRGTVL